MRSLRAHFRLKMKQVSIEQEEFVVATPRSEQPMHGARTRATERR
jgi:hypothetical protein